MRSISVRKSFVVLVVFMFVGILFLGGCGGNDGIAMFEIDEQSQIDNYGTYLKRGSKCYSLSGWITDEKSQEYGIGIDYYKGPVSLAYWIDDDFAVLTTDDFEPITVKSGEKIFCYHENGLIIRPVEFVGYSPRACIRDKAHGSEGHSYFSYWDGNEEVQVFDYETASLFDENMSSIDNGCFSKGDSCTLKWKDDDGDHEYEFIANSRYYRQEPEKEILVKPDDDGVLEYDTSALAPGSYLIQINNELGIGSIITIE